MVTILSGIAYDFPISTGKGFIFILLGISADLRPLSSPLTSLITTLPLTLYFFSILLHKLLWSLTLPLYAHSYCLSLGLCHLPGILKQSHCWSPFPYFCIPTHPPCCFQSSFPQNKLVMSFSLKTSAGKPHTLNNVKFRSHTRTCIISLQLPLSFHLSPLHQS